MITFILNKLITSVSTDVGVPDNFFWLLSLLLILALFLLLNLSWWLVYIIDFFRNIIVASKIDLTILRIEELALLKSNIRLELLLSLDCHILPIWKAVDRLLILPKLIKFLCQTSDSTFPWVLALHCFIFFSDHPHFVGLHSLVPAWSRFILVRKLNIDIRVKVLLVLIELIFEIFIIIEFYLILNL